MKTGDRVRVKRVLEYVGCEGVVSHIFPFSKARKIVTVELDIHPGTPTYFFLSDLEPAP